MVIAEWKHPATEAHCLGYWSLFVDGVDYSNSIPLEKRISHMNTLGIYCSWNNGHYEHYSDGLDMLDWWSENPWIDEIPASPFDIFKAFSLNDWRPGACDQCKRKELEE